MQDKRKSQVKKNHMKFHNYKVILILSRC